jgi:hypothetical protein
LIDRPRRFSRARIELAATTAAFAILGALVMLLDLVTGAG